MIFCNDCAQPMKVEKNGICCVVGDSDGNPYRAYLGDRYICTGCTRRVVVANNNPAYESYRKDFHEVLMRYDELGLLLPGYASLKP